MIEYFISPTCPRVTCRRGSTCSCAARVPGAWRRQDSSRLATTSSRSAKRRSGPNSSSASARVPCRKRTRGARSSDEIFLGLAFTCGLDKVVLPFVDRGIPVEYELVRSIATVSQQKRKKIGVLTTDAKLYATFDMQTMTPRPQRADHRRIAKAVRRGAGRSHESDHRKVRRAAGRAAFVARAATDGKLHRRGEERPADGDFRRSLFDDQPRRAGHDGPQDAARWRQSVHAAAASAAQGRHQPAVENAGRGLRRRQRGLAGAQPLSQAGRHPARMGLRRSRQRRPRAVQRRKSGQLQAAAGAVPVSRFDPGLELLAADLHAAGRHGQSHRNDSLRSADAAQFHGSAADESRDSAVGKADRRIVRGGGPDSRQAQA